MTNAKIKNDFSKVVNKKNVKEYAKFVELALKGRYETQGKINGADFLAGAMCLHMFLKIGGSVPASWVFKTKEVVDSIIEKGNK